MNLEFTFDVVCPYAYLASTQIDALANQHKVQVTWKPVLLGGLFKHLDQPARPADSWPQGKVEHNIRDLARQAELLGVQLHLPPEHPRRTVEAMRLLVSVPQASIPKLAHRLFAAYWQHGEDVSDRAVLGDIAKEFGHDISAIDSTNARDELHRRTKEAHDQGFFGVPTLKFENNWWWGADRLAHVAAALGSQPDPTQVIQPPTGRVLRFFHDFSSPFAYLASTQVKRIAESYGATIEFVPILLGGLFRAIGTPMVPLFAMSEPKQAWMSKDMQHWAKWWGVPLAFPSNFPLRTITPLRVSLVEPSATQALYRAAWVDDLDIGNDTVVHTVLSKAGFDADTLLDAAQSPEIKARLRENTDAAVALGACGVPTFQVDEGPLFWGQDRLHMVEAALSGWTPRIDSERGPVGGFG